MRTNSPSTRYTTRPELGPGGVVTLWSDRFILVRHQEDTDAEWILSGSVITDRLDAAEALELMLKLGGTVVAAQRQEAAHAAGGEPLAAPAAAPGVNPRMHVFGPEDGPTVTLTLPRELVEVMQAALRHWVPAEAGVDGALVDEIGHQLADQRPPGDLTE